MDMKLTDEQITRLERMANSLAGLAEKVAMEVTNDLSRAHMAEHFGDDWALDILFVTAGRAVHDEAQALVARRIADVIASKLTAAHRTVLS